MEEIKSLIDYYNNLGIKLWTESGQLHFKAPVGSLTQQDKTKLKENKNEIIQYLSSLENKPVVHNEKDAYEPFTLTPIQSSYLLGRNNIYDYGGVGCHAYVEIKLTPRCSLERVTKAWHEVILRHDMLRAVIEKEGVQRIVKNAKLPEVKEFYAPNDSYDKLFSDTREEMSKKKYASDVYPLHELRVTSSNDFSVLHFSMDMLVADSVSASVILRDILNYYYEPEKELPKPEITFRDVVVYNQSKTATTKYQVKYNKAVKYWKDRINSLPEEPKLPILANGKGRYEAKFDQMEFSLDKKQWDTFNETAKSKKLTGSSAILAAFAEILSVWSENEHFCINTTTMNRPAIHKQVYDIVGDFTNVNLLEINRISEESFAESAVKIHTQLWSDLEYSDFNGIDVMRLMNKTRKKQISMPYVYTSTIGIKGLDDSRIDVLYKTSQTPQVFIDCQVSENENGVSVIWSVRREVFKKGIIKKMFKQFSELVNELADDISSWDKKYPCKAAERNIEDDIFVSKDGLHKCFENVTGKVYNSENKYMGVLGRYNDDGKVEILGSKENTVEYRGNTVYLDYCENLIKQNTDSKDVYIRKNENKADIYIVPNETDKKDYISFETAKFDSYISENSNEDLIEKEIDYSNEFAVIALMNLFQSGGIFNDVSLGHSFEDIKNKLEVKSEYEFLVKRWLNALCKERYIKFSNDNLYYAIKIDNSQRYEELGKEIQSLISKDENIRSMAEYILNSKDNLGNIITGKKSPLDLFFPQGSDETAFSAYNDNFMSIVMNKAVADAADKITEKKSGRKVKILEVGAGVGGTTEDVLKSLEKYSDIEYYFTDISNYFLKISSARFGKYNNIKYGILDINKTCWEQNTDIGSFDIIIGANVFHNAKNGSNSMKILKEMMSPNGYMIFLDAVEEPYSLMISKSILHNEEILDSRKSDDRIFFNDDEWENMFAENGLSILSSYPNGGLMKKSGLKMYVVRNDSYYSEITSDEVFNIISKEAGFPETIEKTVVSQLLPLDENLQIDRAELEIKTNISKETKPKNDEKLLPSNEIEQKIFDILKEILENDDLSVLDNFFEVGGDSLLASMMITNIRKNIKQAENIEWEKLMQTVLQNPTIKDIAVMLNDTAKENDFCIEYQHGNDNPSQVWVLFVNGTGTMAIYNQLLQIMKANISHSDRVIGLHCGNFSEYISFPHEKVINILAERNTELLEKINAKRYNLIGHCFGGAVAIQTAINLQKKNITNVSVTTIDTRRWNIFIDNSLVIERGFGEMMKSDVKKCGHTISDELLQSNLERFVRKHNKLMTVEELCTLDEFDPEVRECFSKLKDIPQEERLRMLFRNTDSPQTEEQEMQFIMLYKVFYQCMISITSFNPEFYSGEVNAVRCNDRSNFFIPVEEADESDYLKESVSGKVNNYYVDGDHFSCLLDDENVKVVAKVVLSNKTEEIL